MVLPLPILLGKMLDKLLNLPPQTLMSWNCLALAHYVVQDASEFVLIYIIESAAPNPNIMEWSCPCPFMLGVLPSSTIMNKLTPLASYPT
jgi:hypothetical protein